VAWPYDSRLQQFVDGSTNITASYEHGIQDAILDINTTDRRRTISAPWSEWSAPPSNSGAYAGDYGVQWTLSGRAAVLAGPLLNYNGPTVGMIAPLSGSASIATAGSVAGLFKVSSGLVSTMAVDVTASVIASNNATMFIGVASTIAANFRGAAFVKGSGDATWKCRTNDGATTSTTATSSTPVTTAFQQLRIDIFGASQSGGLRADFYIDGTAVASKTTNIDTTTALGNHIALSALDVCSATLYLGEPRLTWAHKVGY
jgi:hypothetical protein